MKLARPGRRICLMPLSAQLHSSNDPNTHLKATEKSHPFGKSKNTMAYQAHNNVNQETSIGYWLVLAGSASNFFLMVSYILDWPPSVFLISLVLTGVASCAIIFGRRFDEHFVSLRASGVRWALGVIVLYLGTMGLLAVFLGTKALGQAAAGQELGKVNKFADFSLDALLLATLAMLAFYVGFWFTKFRGSAGQ